MSEDWITYMPRVDLIERTRRDREAFAALWHGLSDAQMIQRPAVQETWSVKDLIAHITWWEGYMIDRVKNLLAGNPDQRLNSDAEVDAINARVYDTFKDQPLQETLAAFESSWPRVLALLESMSDAQINDKSLYTQAEVPPLHIIIGNTFGHYEEHTEDLQRYLDTLVAP